MKKKANMGLQRSSSDRPSRLDNQSISRIVDEIDSKMKETAWYESEGQNHLWDSLALALGIHRLVETNKKCQAEFEEMCKERDIRSRKDAHPFIRLAKLCFPGRTSRDYHRYAGALGHADSKGWDAETFVEHLADRGSGGMSAMAKEDAASRNAKKGIIKQAPDYLGLLAKSWKKANTIAEFYSDDDGQVGAVLMLGERCDDGTFRVYRILDDPKIQVQAEKMYKVIWMEEEAKIPIVKPKRPKRRQSRRSAKSPARR